MVSPPAGFARIAGAITFPACVLLSGITPPASRQLFADNYNRPAPAAPGRKPSLKILYAGMPLSGRTFVLRTRAGAFALSSWQVKNDGSAPLPAGLSVRLYFSDSIGGSARPLIWEQLPSTDPAYPVEFLWKSRGTVKPWGDAGSSRFRKPRPRSRTFGERQAGGLRRGRRGGRSILPDPTRELRHSGARNESNAGSPAAASAIARRPGQTQERDLPCRCRRHWWPNSPPRRTRFC